MTLERERGRDTLYTQFISVFVLPSTMPLLNHRIEQAFLHSLGGPVESKGSPIPLDLHRPHHRHHHSNYCSSWPFSVPFTCSNSPSKIQKDGGTKTTPGAPPPSHHLVVRRWPLNWKSKRDNQWKVFAPFAAWQRHNLFSLRRRGSWIPPLVMVSFMGEMNCYWALKR